MLNQTKIGRYEVVSTLGQGAMGTVYKAVDPLIERTVAIKTINLNLSKDELAEFEERFYREAKSAGRLNHSNIVTIYDVGETDGIAYIAMEYLEGESLREMLDSGVVLPIDTIVKIASRIASALNYAHENHVVHRDIKPANIMITHHRDVKIMDFGIAQIPTGSRTQLGTVLGSPKYMAPEQVAGEATDGKTDIFALGVVLYELLTGVTPFNGDNLSAIMYKILHEEPAAPSTINPRVPPVFDRIISRALAKRPADRYPSARALARDLRSHDAVLPSEEVRAAGTRKPASTPRPNKTPSGPQDATLFLAPDQARQMLGSSRSLDGVGIQATLTAALRDMSLARKRALWVIPVLIATAFVVLWQMAQSRPDKQPIVPALTSQTGNQLSQREEEAILALQPEIIAPLLPPVKMPAPVQTVMAKPAVREPTAREPELRAHPPVTVVAAPVAQAIPEAMATVSFAISPWGEVFVDGKSVGVSPPMNSLELKAGRHRIEIRNQAFTVYRDTVNLGSGQTLKIRHKFK
ncbi:MAG TPA: protein kinase [Thiobacillus sp.]